MACCHTLSVKCLNAEKQKEKKKENGGIKRNAFLLHFWLGCI